MSVPADGPPPDGGTPALSVPADGPPPDGRAGAPAFDRAAARLEAAATVDPPAPRRGRRRVAVVGLLFGAAILATRVLDRPPDAPPPAPRGRVLFADVEGWYRRTPDEVAVRSPFDLTLGGLPAGLPLTLGPWRGEDRPPDPAVPVWFRGPEVAVERTYRRADGELVWLSVFGSRGNKSFHLFEHTPDTCYPLGGWEVGRFEVTRLPLGPRPLAVNHGEAAGPAGRLVFFYLYLWDSPARSAERGVLSLRIAAPVSADPAATFAMLSEDFLPRLLPTTLAWSRF